jgi:hypothetical protein
MTSRAGPGAAGPGQMDEASDESSSVVHKHFVAIPNHPQGKHRCQISGCGAEVNSNGTSSRLKHLKRFHSAYVDSKPPPPSQSLISEHFGLKPLTGAAAQRTDAAVLYLIVANLLPFSLTDAPRFHELFSCVGVNYKPPCRQTLIKRLDALHKSILAKVRFFLFY